MIHRVTGAALITLAALLIASIPLSTGMLEHNARDRGEIESFLAYVQDSRTEYGARMGLLFVKDSIVSVIVGAGLLLAFMRVNRALAVVGGAGILVSTAGFLTIDALEAAMLPLARDFAEGWPDQTATLATARGLAITSAIAGQLAFSSFAIGTISLGVLFIRARGAHVPPAWVGWLGIVTGVLWLLSWVGVLTEAGQAFIPLGAITTLSWMISLGVWLIRHPEAEEGPSSIRTPSAVSARPSTGSG
jgi:hypothetical protein